MNSEMRTLRKQNSGAVEGLYFSWADEEVEVQMTLINWLPQQQNKCVSSAINTQTLHGVARVQNVQTGPFFSQLELKTVLLELTQGGSGKKLSISGCILFSAEPTDQSDMSD
jgi:hypothetical protein